GPVLACGTLDTPGGAARGGREGPARAPQEERADGKPRERLRPDHVGRASFVRNRTAARREGTRPAKTAARRATASVRPIASIGRERITRFGRPKSGAKATTAWDNRMPSAAPRMAPAKASRTAWVSYTAAIVVGEAPMLRRAAISRDRAWTSSDIAAYTRRAITSPIRRARSRRGSWISATPARRKPTAPRVAR